MRMILFISFMISAFFVNAQYQKVKPIEIRTFKMSKFPIADFPKRSISISDIQVMQMLRDSITLGYAMKGMDNHVIVLVSEKPPTNFLQEGIYKMYQDNFKKEGARILWIIKDLRIGEKAGFNQYSYLRFNADAYISNDLIQYKPVCTIDTVFVSESGADVTAWHGEHIEDAFKILLKRTLQTGKNIVEQNTAGGLTIEIIKDLSKPQINVPILNDEVYREGAYANFEEFLQNRPSVTNFRVFSIGKEKQIKFVKISENNQADTVNIWGLCKGGEIYKFNEGLLVSIEKQRNGFIISNYVEQASRRNSGIAVNAFFAGMVGGIMGGIAGGLIVGITATKTNLSGSEFSLIKSIPYITKAKKQPEATCIDMKTGELSF